MPNETTFQRKYFLMFLLLALKRYACIAFAVGLFVFVFLFIYAKGGIDIVLSWIVDTNFVATLTY